MGRRLRLSALPCRRRSLPHRHSSRCPALSQVPPRYGPDGWHRHGTQPYAVEHMVLGGLFGRQPDARHLGGSVSRQLGLSRYETAFGILHKLRAGMVRPNQDRIGGKPGEHVEIDETWVGGRTRGEGPGCPPQGSRRFAVEVRHRQPGTAQDKRKDGRYAGRVRLAVVPDRSADSLCGFVESAVAPRTLTVTDDWSGYASLGKRGYEHFAVAECGDPEVAEDYLPIIHLVFANLKTWLIGIHHRCQPSIFKPISMSSRSALQALLSIQRLPLPPRHRWQKETTN